MKFKQIQLNPLNKLHNPILENQFFNLIFEIDFSKQKFLPAEQHIKTNLKWCDSFSSDGALLPHPTGRLNYEPKTDKSVENWKQYITFTKDHFIEKIFNEKNDDTEKLQNRWCRSIDELKENITVATDIIKDPPSFEMLPHMDNEFIFAVLIVNLCDNKSTTGFHEISQDLKTIYKAPTQKGEGLLFLNTPGSLHSFKNDSDEERYISYTTFVLNLHSSGIPR